MSARQSQASSRPGVDDEAGHPHWRRNLQVLPYANALCSLGLTLCLPFLPLMLRGLGVTSHLETWMGYMMLVYYGIGFLCTPIWGSIADHFGRRLMVLRAMLGMGTLMMLLPFMSSPLWFAAVFMLIGFFNGFTPAVMSLIVSNTPRQYLGRALSSVQTGALFGSTAGPALGAALAVVLVHQEWTLWISGGLLLTGGVMVTLFVREVVPAPQGPWRPQWLGALKELWAVPGIAALLMIGLTSALMWYGNVTVLSIYTLQLLEGQPEGHASEALWVGAVAMALSLSSLLAAPLWGRLIDRHDPVRVLGVAMALGVATSLLPALVQTPLQLTLARVAFGLAAVGIQPVTMRLLKEYAPAGMEARAISYVTSFQLIAMGLAPFAAGLIGPALGLRVYFVAMALLGAASLAFWRAQSRRMGRAA